MSTPCAGPAAALFPHLTVWRQVTSGADCDPAVAAHWLQRLRIEELAHRRPDELSGGQQRRVALARALASNPRLLLLDEPFTGLDAPVRDQLRRELRTLARDTGLPTVLVTHDAAEAALLADEVLVIDEGRLLQAGAQPEVYAHPVGPTVARLLGSPNLLDGQIPCGSIATPVRRPPNAPGSFGRTTPPTTPPTSRSRKCSNARY